MEIKILGGGGGSGEDGKVRRQVRFAGGRETYGSFDDAEGRKSQHRERERLPNPISTVEEEVGDMDQLDGNSDSESHGNKKPKSPKFHPQHSLRSLRTHKLHRQQSSRSHRSGVGQLHHQHSIRSTFTGPMPSLLPPRGVLHTISMANLHSHGGPLDLYGLKEEEVDTSEYDEVPKVPHSWLYSMLSSSSKKPQAVCYKYTISIIIIADCLTYILSTEAKIATSFPLFFQLEETFVCWLFLIEYILRLIVITEARRYRHPLYGRLRYAVSLGAIIDILSFTPYFVAHIFGGDFASLPSVRLLRVFRLFRILKTESFLGAGSSAIRVIRFNLEILLVGLLLCLGLLLLTSTALFILQPKGLKKDLQHQFDSIPSCMYLSLLMLTGQGAPTGKFPWYTKLAVMTTAVLSIVLFAIPASMLTWGFEAEAIRIARERYKREQDRIEREEGLVDVSDEQSDSTDSHEGMCAEDEEYFRSF